MLRLLAEHEGFRYYLLLVHEIDYIAQWPKDADPFSLFIYIDRKIEDAQEIARFESFASSARLAGARIICSGGLMKDWIHELFHCTSDTESEDSSYEDDCDPSDSDEDLSMDELVWHFMTENMLDRPTGNKVAIFQKDDPNWKQYVRSLRKWKKEGLGSF